MYKLLRELKITDRIVNEENDYLLEEEYNKLKEMCSDDTDLLTVINAYNQYCGEYIKKQEEKGNYVILTDISMATPEKYSASTNNDIRFYIHTHNKKTGQYVTYDCIKEEGFRPAFIKSLYNALIVLSEKTDYVVARYKTSYEKTRNFEFKGEQPYMEDLKRNQKIRDLIEYFEDKVITVQKDTAFEQDIKEIYDLLENL